MMKKYIILISLPLIISVLSCDKEETKVEGIMYTVTFTFNWNSTDFPADYPSNAHFSKLIGWSHLPTSDFFQPGTLASEGIEVMAETGSTSPLDNEINAMIANSEGLSLFIDDPLSSGTGIITLNIVVDNEFSSVTLATMIAPSPDWYVAVVNINLLENGEFVQEKTVDAFVYDSGTDSGVTYTSGNIETSPKELITLFTDYPLGDGMIISPAIATVKFTKQ
jgi:hypothetical protein